MRTGCPLVRGSTYHDKACGRCKLPQNAVGPLIYLSEFGTAVCEDCYPEFLARRIEATLRRFHMFPRRARVAVAVSGGADSGCLLHALATTVRWRLNFSLVAIHVDMGLGEYSRRSLEAAQAQARMARVELCTDAVSAYGVQVRPVRQWPTCAVCGAVRRAILPLLARRAGADVVCTGHTLDDQLQYMLKGLLSGRLVAPPPLRPPIAGWPAKAKPLITIPDAATSIYTTLVGLPVVSGSCPHFDPQSHRLKEVFALLEQRAPMGKLQFWRALRRVMAPPEEPEGEPRPCPGCGQPTYLEKCPLCRLREGRGDVRA